MIDGIPVKCNYCGTTILLRFQMGYFNIPFDICCPCCKVHIKGIRKIESQHSFNVNNASEINRTEDNTNYFADFSVELPHRKITKYESLESLVSSGFSPFMMTAQLFEFERYNALVRNISRFISFRDNFWQNLSAYYDLYFEDKIELLKKPLIEISKAYVVENQLDASMALHQLLILSFNSILPDNSLREFSQYGSKIIQNIAPSNVALLISRLNGKTYFFENGKRIINIVTRWISMFETFIPAVTLSLGNAKEKIDKNCYGIATTSFEDFKSFYSDSYELILDLIDIAVALNNIEARGNIDKFSADCNCKDYDSYRNLMKGEKSKKLAPNEAFSKPVNLDRNVRNAIGHFNFEYDVSTQKIVFKDKFKGKENDVSLYLLDLACLCYDNIVILLYLNELMYTLRKFDYLNDGLKPHIGVISQETQSEE